MPGESERTVPTLVIGSAVYYARRFSQQLRRRLRLAFVDLRHFAEENRSHAAADVTYDDYLQDASLRRCL